MRLLSIICLFTATFCMVQSGEIISNGATPYAIVVAEDASITEISAARELQDFIMQSTGVEIALIRKATEQPAVYIGQRAAEKYFDLKFDDYSNDEITLFVKGNSLILAGGTPRGTLYSVYEFAERYLGVRFLTADCTVIPKTSTLEMPQESFRYRPVLTRRESYYRDVVGEYGEAEAHFAARRRLNGFFQDIPEKWGGTEKMLGFCHTFGPLINEDQYFASHPEWFSMDEHGKRVAGHLLGQLCLTDPGLRSEFIRKAKQWLSQNPAKKFIAISMNDNAVYCHCPRCAESDQRLGNPTDTMLEFVNMVAEELEKDFPGIKVETLAYLYAATPPRTVKPRNNVIIRLCSLDADFSKPIDSEANAEFRDQVIAWGKIAPGQLGIWHYVINFDNPLIVHPNLTLFAEDWRFFRDNGVTLSYAEGDSRGLLGFLRELRLYVLSALAWNPDLNQDALIAEFLENFYGPTAPEMAEFVALVDGMGRKSTAKIAYAEKNATNWFPPEAVIESYAIFKRALAAAGNDPVLIERLKKARLGLDLTCLDWRLRDPDNAIIKTAPATRELIDEIQELLDTLPKPMYETLLARYRRTLLENPENDPMLGPVIGDKKCMVFQEFFYYNGSKYASQKKDAAASEGMAVRFEPGHAGKWGAGVFLWKPEIRNYETLNGKRHFYATFRRDGGKESGAVLTIGLYDRITRKFSMLRHIDASECGTDEYHLVDLGIAAVNDNSDLYIESADKENSGYIWLDRLVMVEEK